MFSAQKIQRLLFKDHRNNSTKTIAIFFGALVIFATIPLTVFLTQRSEDVLKNPKAAATRDPYKQPFSSDSPWNMPIGSNAQYVATQINMSGKWQDVEGELVFINAAAPLRTLYAGTTTGGEQWWNYPAGGGGPSCLTSLANKGQVHVEDNYIVPDPVNGGEDGSLPNRGGGALKTDNRTIQEFQYSTRCTATGPVSAGAVRTTYDIYGKGIPTNSSTTSPEGYGAHGGSGLSAVGGNLRKWEVADTGPIRHALKMTVNSLVLSKCNGGFRWPAIIADQNNGVVGDQNEYAGPVCDFRMGSLTAINPSVNCQTFVTTAFGKRICQALQDYGAYIVDTGPRSWGAMTILGEYGTASAMSSAGSDIEKMFGNLYVIANNSSTNVGGGGTPRVALADPLCTTNPCSTTGDTTNPTATLTAPSAGATVSGSAVTLSATAADNVGVSSVQFFVDGQSVNTDGSSPYSYSWDSTTKPNGTYAVFARAFDAAGNQGNSTSITITVNNTIVDTIPPVISGGRPTGILVAGTTSTTLSVTTNEAATCKYGTTAGVAYSSMASTFSTTGGTNHSTSITGLTNGITRSYYVRCQDTSSNSNTSDYNVSFSIANPATPLPAPWTSGDIGTVGNVGSSVYSSGTFTISGSGDDIWNNADAFQFANQPLSGDGYIVAKINSQANTDPWAKAGVMIRENNTSGSKHAFLFITPGNGVALKYRTTADSTSTPEGVGVGYTLPIWLKLQRVGNTFTGFTSTNGTSFTQVGTITISMNVSTLVGLAVTSHNTTSLSSVNYSNVAVTKTTSSILGDVNSDGKVNILDISRIISNWGAINKPVEDVNQDGHVDISDISQVIAHWI